MNCKVVQKNFNSLIKGTLKGRQLRQTYYHIENCSECKEVLLDEFSFYATFNDLDKDLNFNYKNRVDEMLNSIKTNIEVGDIANALKYVVFSIIICIGTLVILAIALRLVYR